MKKIKRIDENKKEIIYNSIEEASKTIPSKLDYWKIQMFICDAINNRKKAFKSNWEIVE